MPTVSNPTPMSEEVQPNGNAPSGVSIVGRAPAVTPLQYIFRGQAEPGIFAHAMLRWSDYRFIEPAVGNKPPEDAPYLCLVPVLDYWRMDIAQTKLRGLEHYSGVLEADVQRGIRERRALLIFDISNEAPAFNREIFRQLFEYLDAHSLPANQVIWLSSNKVIEKDYQHAFGGMREEHIRFEQYNIWLKMVASMFARTGQAILGKDPQAFVNEMNSVSSKDKLLLCLNATPRPHRVVTVAALLNSGILPNSLVSFPGLMYAKGATSEATVREFIRKNPGFAGLGDSVERVMRLQPLRVDDFAETGNALANKIDVTPYLRTFFSLVTETDLSGNNVEWVTEKTVKPFCLGHPTLIIGGKNPTQDLSELGFNAWSDVIDRSCECEIDPIKRFWATFKEVQRQVTDINADAEGWLSRIRPASQENIHHALSGKFLAEFEDKYERNLVDRFRTYLARH